MSAECNLVLRVGRRNERTRRETMEVTDAIDRRKSVRAYEGKPLPKEVVLRIVEAGQWPPNAGPFHLSVIRNDALREKINNRTKEAMVRSDIEFLRQRASLPGYEPLYGAPAVILLSAPADAPFGAMNTALAAENMLLQATDLGLGSCFLVSPTRVLNGDDNRELAKESGVPEGYVVQCAVIVGYAAVENKFSLGERAKKGAVGYID
jgi:FMN reductase [NAD(P)H]